MDKKVVIKKLVQTPTNDGATKEPKMVARPN
jgi:hypothetical protein